MSLSTTFLFFFVVVLSNSLFILSQAFVLVNNFLLFFNSSVILPCTQVFVNNFFHFFITVSGEGGIWTLAPLLTTCTLSRGVPSASLGTSPNQFPIIKLEAERVGFEPTRPCGQTVFKTASLWPLRYLSKALSQTCSLIIPHNTIFVKHFSKFFSFFYSFPIVYKICYSHALQSSTSGILMSYIQ